MIMQIIFFENVCLIERISSLASNLSHFKMILSNHDKILRIYLFYFILFLRKYVPLFNKTIVQELPTTVHSCFRPELVLFVNRYSTFSQHILRLTTCNCSIVPRMQKYFIYLQTVANNMRKQK